MSNSLLDKIQADAKAQVTDIKAASESKVAAVQKQTDAAVKALEADAVVELKKEQSHRELVAASKAKQTHKLAVQKAKREAIDAVFAEAFAQLSNQSTDEYVAEYQKRLADEVPESAEVTSVTAPEHRQAETATILASANVTVTPEFTTDIAAGLVVTTTAGVFDLTLDRRFAESRPELEMQVVAALYG